MGEWSYYYYYCRMAQLEEGGTQDFVLHHVGLILHLLLNEAVRWAESAFIQCRVAYITKVCLRGNRANDWWELQILQSVHCTVLCSKPEPRQWISGAISHIEPGRVTFLFPFLSFLLFRYQMFEVLYIGRRYLNYVSYFRVPHVPHSHKLSQADSVQ